ncbi:LuxR family transcriptional regulator [Nonomuraea monospora]|uniref:LuxR family transcriptional regulator n=1 Tax=Nonomuraea monospora TaxID=568818 RepID=A0ABP5PVS6_9ACTN
MLIEGAPGSGKSRLLAELAKLAEADGLRVRTGAGVPDAHNVPFGPLLDTMLSGPDPLMDRSRLEELSEAADQRFWLLQEVQHQLEQAALDRPIVIVMDDVQWCDPATVTALNTLPSRLSGQAILWVLAMREHAQTGTARIPATTRIVLRPLSGAAVEALAGDILNAAVDPALLELAHKADGRPLLLVELLNGMREEGAIRVESGVAHLTNGRIPVRFRSSIRRRLEQLSPLARDTVRFAAVLGRDVDLDVLAELIRRSPADLVFPLQEALDADLLVETEGRLAFRHDLLREAIQTGVPAAFRHLLRRQSADVRLRRGAAVMEVASDLADTAVPGDHEAVSLLRRAAADFAPTSPTTAVELSRRAMELAPADSADAGALVAETITLLWQAGRDVEARAMADNKLAGLLEPQAEAHVRLSLARLSSQYSFTEAVHQCRIALGLPGLTPSLRAQLLAVQSLNMLMSGDVEATAQVVGQALDAAGDAGDRVAAAVAASVDSAVAFYRGGWQRGFDRQRQAARLAADAGIAHSLWVPEACWTGFMHNAAGDSEAALREAENGLREAHAYGQAAALCFWSLYRARILLDAGRLADARAEAEGVLAMLADLGAGNFADATARYALARVALHQGDRQAITRASADGERMMRDEAQVIRRTGAWMLALAADAAGDTDRAMELTREADESLDTPDSSMTTPLDPADDVVLVRMALRAGRRDRAEHAVRVAEQRAGRNPGFPFLTAVAAHARGLLEGDKELLERAAHLFAGFPRLIVRASALEDAGQVGHLERALELYERAGASRDAARVRRRLRDAGVRRRGRATGAARGWDSLTASELQVVRLVAQGATNRQAAEQLFLSPHTVNTHLRHAYAKLDVNSRVELTRLVLTHDG